MELTDTIEASVTATSGRKGSATCRLHMSKELIELLDLRDLKLEFVEGEIRGGQLLLKRTEFGRRVITAGTSTPYVHLPLGLQENAKYVYKRSFFDGVYDIHMFKRVEANEQAA